MSWLKKYKRVLSIDISADGVKTLELSKDGERYRVESYAIVPLYQNPSTISNEINTNSITNAIKVALDQTRSKEKQASVAISGSAVITKIITLPSVLNESEIEEQILIEADQYVPYSLNEVNFDFEVQGLNKNNPQMIDVLFVASRRENVDDLVDALSKAGLKTILVDVEMFAIENAFSLVADYLDHKQHLTVAVVDIGATVSTLNVLHNGHFLYTNEQEFGGKQLSEELQKRLGIPYSEVYLFINQDTHTDQYNEEVLTPFKQSMGRQIQRLLQFFTSSSAMSVDCILLAGGCASIKDIDKFIEDKTGMPVYIANPFLKMDLSPEINIKHLYGVAPSMMINCGLALRSFDL